MDTVKRILEEKGAEVFSVSPETTVMDAARLMSEHRIGAVLVMASGHVRGIFSERDLLQRVLLRGSNSESLPVSEVMSTDMVYVTPDTPVREAMAVMTERRCRHLPVMDEGRLCGMISIGDCTRWVSRDQDFTIRHLTDYIANKYPG
ncbi:MAG: CBS domain-containing protein [Acidobacteriota bacterium]